MNTNEANRILDVLRTLLDERFDIPASAAARETKLRELGVDSMMVMDVMLDVEDRIGVKLNDLALPRDASLGDVADMIERNLGVNA